MDKEDYEQECKEIEEYLRLEKEQGPLKIRLRIETSESPFQKCFNPDGSPTVERLDTDHYRVGLMIYDRPERLYAGELPTEAKKAIMKDVKPFLVTNRGRPEGTGTYRTEVEFVNAVRGAKQQIENQGEYPSQERVAEMLSMTEKTVERLCRKYHVRYRDI